MSKKLENELPEILEQFIGAKALFKVSTFRIATNLQRNHTPVESEPVIQGVRKAASELYPNHRVIFAVPGGRRRPQMMPHKPVLIVVMKSDKQEAPLFDRSGVEHRNYIIKRISIQKINATPPAV